MSRSAALNVENNFSRGFITEATALNFPENAATEAFNCIFEERGAIRRRLGIDYEEDFSLFNTSVTASTYAVREYLWENVGNSGDLSFVVVQHGDKIFFYETSAGANLSANKKSFSVDLDSFKTAGAPSVVTKECQFAFGNGHLFVVHPYCDPFYIQYSFSADDITTHEITLQIRDFAGIENDGTTDIEHRPGGALTNAHNYNLRNQGWYAIARSVEYGGTSVLGWWDALRSDWPSNSDIWWLFKDANGELDGDKINATTFTAGTPAPKGHFLLNPFYEDRSAASGIGSLSVISSSFYRPTTVAFFTSRVFYGGVTYSTYGTKIYFSQIIESDEQYGKCYQKFDPTAEDITDLLPTDGGVIVIPEMGKLIRLVSTQNALFVFANNGIWAITGNEGGFRANDYTIRKISNLESLDHKSFIDVNGLPLWWNSNGIHTLNFDVQSLQYNASSLTDTTIKSFFKDIPLSSKYYAKGAFNQTKNIVQWLYRSTEPDNSNVADNYFYDRILNLNLTTGAFYLYSVGSLHATNGPFITGIVSSKGFGVERDDEVVVDESGVSVTDSGIDVTVDVYTATPVSSEFYYTTLVKSTTWRLTFSLERDGGYLDWDSAGTGQDFDSYIFTGYKTHGNAVKQYQANYVFVFMEPEQNSSLFLNHYWDFANHGNSGKVSTTQQCYNNIGNFGLVKRRLKIRGSGLSAQLRFMSETGKPFNLIGWSSFETSNNLP